MRRELITIIRKIHWCDENSDTRSSKIFDVSLPIRERRIESPVAQISKNNFLRRH